MKRNIIEIDRDLCNGCGLCISACHEGALVLDDERKATLISDSYCDGLGNCLPECPTGAIKIVEREAEAFDEELVKRTQQAKTGNLACGCPSAMAKKIQREAPAARPVEAAPADMPSELTSWPVQIKLVPVNAPYFDGAHLLIAADCCAFAHANFHRDFMRGRVTIIGCPKLDDVDYSEKLTAILAHNDIQSVTIARMEVPCCGGIAHAAKTALQNCGKLIPWGITIIGTDGEIRG